ncbi:MAG: hypothetical protein IT355_16330 [Gemmatimonadaceae bacterium]|nr:hypothetical protein [Gemmatimonadaceae bacterium]
MPERHFASDAIDVRAVITEEQGRWVLVLEVLMVPDRPDHVIRHRIADYATRERAEVAAKWTVNAANRTFPHPRERP